MITKYKIFEAKYKSVKDKEYQKQKSLKSDIRWGMFNDNLFKIEETIAEGGDVNTQDGQGTSIFIYLAKLSDIAFFSNDGIFHLYDIIIKKGADWNHKDYQGFDFSDFASEELITSLKNKYPTEYNNYLINKQTNKFKI